MSQEPMEKVDRESRKWLQDRCIELEIENARLRKMLEVGQNNNRDLWAALNLIRQEVEEHGAIPSGEHNDPTPQEEAELIVSAIAALAGKD